MAGPKDQVPKMLELLSTKIKMDKPAPVESGWTAFLVATIVNWTPSNEDVLRASRCFGGVPALVVLLLESAQRAESSSKLWQRRR
eukprot:3634330-Amphidinium_carterae.1